MKTTLKLFALTLFFVFTSFESGYAPPARDFYQLNIYSFSGPEQEAAMDSYLKSAWIPALHRAGVDKVGVFKTIEGKNGDNNLLMVFIPFKSWNQLQELSIQLESDDEYLKAAVDFIEAPHDNPPYERLETIIMTAFSATPHFHVPDLKSEKSERVYELRSYQSATEKLYKRKVEMFDEGESALFIKLGFQPLFFGEVISGGDMPNLMYMTCHANEEAQAANWKSFVDHPEWNAMKVMERYQNTVSHIDKYLVYPKEYSEL